MLHSHLHLGLPPWYLPLKFPNLKCMSMIASLYIVCTAYLTPPPLHVITNYKVLHYAIISTLVTIPQNLPPSSFSFKCSYLYFTRNIIYVCYFLSIWDMFYVNTGSKTQQIKSTFHIGVFKFPDITQEGKHKPEVKWTGLRLDLMAVYIFVPNLVLGLSVSATMLLHTFIWRSSHWAILYGQQIQHH
jgi:hypothetical protein